MPYKDPAKNKACMKKWNADNKARKAFTSRKSWLKKAYGITPEQYEELAALYDGKCAICDNPPAQSRKSLDIDHCHKLGHIRGPLCSKCNKLLGMVNDNIETLKSAITYLESYNESVEEMNRATNSI